MSAVIDEWKRCEPLKQQQIDRLRASGVDLRDLVSSADGSGLCLCRDRVVIDVDRHRFEFARHSRFDVLAVSAIVIVAFDRDAEPIDLVAWRDGVLASWLGRAEMLGLEQFHLARMGEAFPVFADPLDWLLNSRYGCVPIDMARCGPALRDEGRLIVDDYAKRVELLGSMRVRMPSIDVRQKSKVAA